MRPNFYDDLYILLGVTREASAAEIILAADRETSKITNARDTLLQLRDEQERSDTESSAHSPGIFDSATVTTEPLTPGLAEGMASGRAATEFERFPSFQDLYEARRVDPITEPLAASSVDTEQESSSSAERPKQPSRGRLWGTLRRTVKKARSVKELAKTIASKETSRLRHIRGSLMSLNMLYQSDSTSYTSSESSQVSLPHPAPKTITAKGSARLRHLRGSLMSLNILAANDRSGPASKGYQVLSSKSQLSLPRLDFNHSQGSIVPTGRSPTFGLGLTIPSSASPTVCPPPTVEAVPPKDFSTVSRDPATLSSFPPLLEPVTFSEPPKMQEAPVDISSPSSTFLDRLRKAGAPRFRRKSVFGLFPGVDGNKGK
ncbi:uncharacterized protein J3D65DRAFT_670638 [Phyllosticta citribraziliensis]|uniref:Uncharacterized protein n=1 Tax=Phyllosticta citribraziliensis TaxID=989973 RepID=A0ABR1L9R8_9PEZI